MVRHNYEDTKSFCFAPFDTSRLKEMRPDLSDSSHRKLLQAEESVWQETTLEDSADDYLQCSLMINFDGFSRVGPDGNEVDSLPAQCGIGYDDEILNPKYESFGNATDYSIDPWPIDLGDAYISADGKPHVLMTMINHFLPAEDLLRAEAMVVLGVMLTRLIKPPPPYACTNPRNGGEEVSSHRS
ncbi:hypothetical protein BJY01DRAFT_255073 [Aspergillus pseudoustus]|uniref:Uncharacterized protein n=1 Tax=Aspergillus pseudoustus TaxID=1810923 RepID=A0ABR4INJ8_9EURO